MTRTPCPPGFRRFAKLLPFLVVVATHHPAAAAETGYTAMTTAIADKVIVPAFRGMADAMAALESAMTAHCATPTTASFGAAKAAFHKAMSAWQRGQPFAFGPLLTDSRATRIEFWPDRRGTGQRQARSALAAEDPTLLRPGGLDGKSVALQSLVTFEQLLYDSTVTPYACAYAAAIARFQKGIATAIVADWTGPDGYREIMRTAKDGNAHYRDAKEAATDLLKSVAGSLDAIIEQKLERPLGASLADAYPERAESWRSARSLDNIVANLETLTAMFAVPDGLGDQLARAGAGALGAGMAKSFESATALAKSLRMPLSQAVADETERGQVEALLDALRDLRILVRHAVADELGIVIGFNSLDGD
ncbi:MAG: imelysin family protein [Rhodospirillaceae bacterium]